MKEVGFVADPRGGGEWYVLTTDGETISGPYDTHQEAEDILEAIHHEELCNELNQGEW